MSTLQRSRTRRSVEFSSADDAAQNTTVTVDFGLQGETAEILADVEFTQAILSRVVDDHAGVPLDEVFDAMESGRSS